MIKKFWVVRSREKLFWGLNLAIALLSAGYTLLTVLVLDDRIPFRHFMIDDLAMKSRFWLFSLPLITCLLLGLFYFLRRRELILPSLKSRSLSAEATAKRQSLYLERLAYGTFPLILFLFFWQISRLNTAKIQPGFSLLIPLLCLGATIVYWIITIIQISRIR